MREFKTKITGLAKELNISCWENILSAECLHTFIERIVSIYIDQNSKVSVKPYSILSYWKGPIIINSEHYLVI